MTNTNVASPAAATSAPLAPADPASIRALHIAAHVMEIDTVWQRLMTTTVIDVVPGIHPGDVYVFSKCLRSAKAKAILTTIWIDSGFFSDAELTATGSTRLGSPSTPLNVHKIAKKIAPSSEHLDKEEKHIWKIIDAAEAYGLVSKARFNNSRTWKLSATESLDRLMRAHCTNCYDVCADVAALGPEA